MMNRRKAIKTIAMAGAALAALPEARAQGASSMPAAPANGPFTLPPLPYPYDALEPYIDARTMEIHHDKHHAAYVANLNKAVAEVPALATMSEEDMLKDLNAIPERVRMAVRNNGGGDYNHSLFWQMLKKNGGKPRGVLANAIDSAFGSFSAFQDSMTKAALGQFGSGWAWLVMDADRRLSVEPTANQDSPISDGKWPLLGVDVWEHAYYLKYQNRRPEYVAAFFHVVNWDFVSERHDKLITGRV